MATLKIGLFGFGCVGQGLYDIFREARGFNAEIVKIGVKNREKKRTLPATYFTYDKWEILDNPDINLVVELIDDAEEAYNIVSEALKRKKNVVTANKRMVANYLPELLRLQRENNVSLLYEASVCGSIPIIRNLEEYYDNELLFSVSGIFNGSSNYILSKIFNENVDYDTALRQAQELGFAETDPTLDVGGFDPKFKLVIIALHSYGLFVNHTDVLNIGIQNLSLYDIRYAKEKGYKIKLVPTVKKLDDNRITLYVLPQFVNEKHYLYNVENEYNGVIVEAAFADKQVFVGKGAGGHPTGSAVLSDISALRYDYRYEYRKTNRQEFEYSRDVELDVYLRYEDNLTKDLLGIRDIAEDFRGKDFRYVTGTVRLDDLVRNSALLNKPGTFLVALGPARLPERAVKFGVTAELVK